MREGYIVLATGPAKYVEMARNLAASIRVMDQGRGICLIHDRDAVFTPEDARLFDDRALLEPDPVYPGVMDKIRIHHLSPYDRTMFIDADCLLLKRDIESFWTIARRAPLTIIGGRRTSGAWKGADVARLLAQENAPYLVGVHSGAFCFDRSPAAAAFFAGLNDFYLRRRDHLCVTLHRGVPAQTDELYLGLWMGLNGLDGAQGTHNWIISTWRAFGFRIDPRQGTSIMRKPRRSTFGIPNPLLGWDRLNPTIGHFVGLKPRRIYDDLSRYFRAQMPNPG